MRSRSYAQKIHSPFAATQILHLLNNTRKVRVCIFINTTLILLKRCYKIYVARILYHLCWKNSHCSLPVWKSKNFCWLWFDTRLYQLCLSFLLLLGRQWASTATNQISVTRNLFQSPAQRHNRQKHAKKAAIFR